jgi:serine/threonine-protein kinase
MSEPAETRRPAVVTDLTGTTVGRFHITAKLGEGGMGQVYRADDTRLKRCVALKRISPYLRNNEHYRRRFLKEAERASALSYDHIAGVYDVFEEGGEIFIVMEYVEGETLRHRVQQPFTVDEFLPIAMQCVAALQAAHGKGIAHRDLKPENIMLTAGGRAKILDFGVAKLLPQARDQAATESLGSVGGEGFSGTVAYAAPEALLEQELDERADIFSLGVVFYEMLAGQHPFRVAGYTGTTDRILHHTPEPLSEANPLVPVGLAGIIHRMVAKEPADRYANATELLEDLRRSEHREPVSAPEPAPSAPQEEGFRLTRKRALVTAVALAVLLGTAYFIRQKWLEPAPARVRVVILPFENRTANKQLDDYRLTLADILAARLSGSGNILVHPYQQTVQILEGFPPETATGEATVEAVADFSQSRFVVTPGMYRVGNNLQLQAKLFDAATKKSGGVLLVEGRLAGTPEDTYYGMLDELAQMIDRHFKELGPGEDYRPRPAASLPRSPVAGRHLAAGKKALALGDYAGALASFEQLTREDPEYALGYTWMAHIYGLLGYDEKARELAEEAAKRVTPEMPLEDAYFIQANLALSKYDFAAAEAKYRELIQLRSDEAIWYAGLGAVFSRQGRHPEAIPQYQSALQRDPSFIAAQQELATLYRRTGALEQAVGEAEKSLKFCRALHNRECEAGALLELSEVSRIKGGYGKAQEYAEQGQQIFQELNNEVGISLANLRLGNLRFHQGDFPGARRYWQQIVSSSGRIRNNRNVVTALMNTGVSYSREGDLARTIEYYELALSQQWPARWEQTQVKSNLAGIYVEFGVDPKRGAQVAREALDVFQQVGDRDGQAQTHIPLSHYSMQTGDYAQALEHTREAENIWKEQNNRERLALAIYTTGLIYFVQNQYEPAGKSFAEALTLAEQVQDSFRTADSQILLGWTSLRLGEPTRARELLEGALQSVRQNAHGELLPPAHAALGEFHWHHEEPGRARSSFRQAMSLPKEPAASGFSIEARSNLCLLEAEQNLGRDLANCTQAVAQARRLTPVHALARALTNQARVHILRKEYGQAIPLLEEVVGMKTLGLEYRAQAHFAWGQALEGLGKTDEAKAAFQQARETIQQLQRTLAPEHRQGFAARPELQPLFVESKLSH